MCSSSCLYIGSPKSYSFISDLSEFLLTSITFATLWTGKKKKKKIGCDRTNVIEQTDAPSDPCVCRKLE